uniref:Ig-like domain-containing protein n=1 Tax=Eptatretus burgeri TaxID=7764 RepID=A0A8C4R3S2_EPTBU
MLFYYSSIILCKILLSESQSSQDTNHCTIEEIKHDGILMELCVQREVIGVRSEDVTLPCWFHHNQANNVKRLSLILSRAYADESNVVILDSATNFIGESFEGRIQIVGNPSEGEGTVRIRDLKMEDEGMYVCRFEFTILKMTWFSGDKWRPSGFQAKEGKRTELRIDVHPRILHIWREVVNSSTSWRLLCEAEAKPRPIITWWNPQGLLVYGSESVVSPNDQNQFQIVSSLNMRRGDPEGKYSCLVRNKYGVAKDFVFFEELETTVKESIAVVCSITLIGVIILIVVGFIIYKKQQTTGEGNSTQP